MWWKITVFKCATFDYTEWIEWEHITVVDRIVIFPFLHVHEDRVIGGFSIRIMVIGKRVLRSLSIH